MNPSDRKALIAHRVQQARDALLQAEALLKVEQSFGAVNRSYYAMFYATLAVLLSRDLGSSKHSGVFALFDREFVKTGEIEPKWSKLLYNAFIVRSKGDYDDWFVMSKEESFQMLADAKEFVERLQSWLEQNNLL